MQLTPPALALVALGLAVTGCSAADEAAAGGAAAGGSGATALAGTLDGAGASSQEAAMTAWRAGFQQANPATTVNYDPVGSGAGREQFLAGGTAFAGTDSPLDDEELAAARERCLGTAPVEVPAYVSPIAVVHNVPGVDRLRLSPGTLAGIFAGGIARWDDPAIAESNPDADLPDLAITPVHRADDSGTTENFTDYLARAAPDAWPHEPDGSWPLQSGEAAQGTSGVVAAVRTAEGAVGYADAGQAGDLGMVSVGVGDGYVAATAEAAAKVLEVSPRLAGRPDTDLAVDLERDTAESGTYPIVLASYLVACRRYPDAGTADLVRGFLTYAIGPDGQRAAAAAAGSAPLPGRLGRQALAVVDRISAAERAEG